MCVCVCVSKPKTKEGWLPRGLLLTFAGCWLAVGWSSLGQFLKIYIYTGIFISSALEKKKKKKRLVIQRLPSTFHPF